MLSFTRGLTVRTDARILRPGERYLEPRAARMWQLITELLNDDTSHARAVRMPHMGPMGRMPRVQGLRL